MKPPTLPKIKLNKRIILQAIGIGLALMFGWWTATHYLSCAGGMPVLKKTQQPLTEKKIEQPPLPVKVHKVARVNFRDTLPALGGTRGFREYDLKFLIGGTLEYVNFREGEKITQGDIIASLDQKEALLKLEYSKIEYEKMKKLYDLGSVIEAKFKQSQIEYQSAKAELDKTTLVAFSDGYIASIASEKGANVTPQDKVATFVDFKDVFVEFGVIEKELSKLKEGQKTELSLDAFPDEIFKGQIDSLSPVVEGRTRTMKVRAKIANPDERIRPGMFGRVAVLVHEKEDAIVIPSGALKKKEDQYFVYVVHPEEGSEPTETNEDQPDVVAAESAYGTTEVRNIEVAYVTPDSIEIKEGVEEGELIAIDVEQELPDKTRVEISETQEGIF